MEPMINYILALQTIALIELLRCMYHFIELFEIGKPQLDLTDTKRRHKLLTVLKIRFFVIGILVIAPWVWMLFQ